MQKIVFISNWTQGTGMSGGDRIWIEFAKVWKEKVKLTVVGSQEAIAISKRYGLNDVEFLQSMSELSRNKNLAVGNLIKNIIKRTLKGAQYIKKHAAKIIDNTNDSYIYSVSDFWPDALPAFVLKRINPKAVWVAGFYLFAPLPWKKESPYKGKYMVKGLMYWLIQRPVYWIVKSRADIVFVTSEPDVARFVTRRRTRDKVVVIQGGVDISDANKYLETGNVKAVFGRKYDACFLGRLHHQKGVLRLIEIWKLVCVNKPDAKLALIGDGELEGEIKLKISEYGLENNVEMFGFLDGEPKYEIFKDSKMMVHPATYDSGGMAAAEGMGWGLPGVSFDLEALNTYYPKGMLKTPREDNQAFADNIHKLLSDQDLYDKIATEARELVLSVWDWNKRAAIVFDKVNSIKTV